MSLEPAARDAPLPACTADPDAALAAAIVAGDEAAFLALLTRYQAALVRLARVYLADPATADAVVQATWTQVLQALPGWDRRAALKTWIFAILVRQAQSRGPIPGDDDHATTPLGPCVAPARFRPAGAPWAGGWATPPSSWDTISPEQLQVPATRAVIAQTISGLPPGPRAVVTLRDVEGWAAEEVGVVLGLGERQQRQLLNYARAQVRSAVAHYLTGEGGGA
jgi:RNA polymerase sigma-70 factor (ECF subfamily)